MPFLGAHQSVGKGLHVAFERISAVGGESLQIFTRNQRQWRPKPLSKAEIKAFRQAWEAHGRMIVTSHASYLVNLASAKPDMLSQSITAFTEELRRCDQLGIPFVVLHPGSHGGDGIETGLERLIAALDSTIEQAASPTMVLLETTAGQGSGLGSTFAELGYVRSRSRYPEKIGICLDTCHVFAAGHDLRSPQGYQAMMDQFEREIGLAHLHFLHLNDSKKDLGSRVDRHEHIGEGCIGLEGFRHVLNDPRLSQHAMTLETPKSDDLSEDIENLRRLRALLEPSQIA